MDVNLEFGNCNSFSSGIDAHCFTRSLSRRYSGCIPEMWGHLRCTAKDAANDMTKQALPTQPPAGRATFSPTSNTCPDKTIFIPFCRLLPSLTQNAANTRTPFREKLNGASEPQTCSHCTPLPSLTALRLTCSPTGSCMVVSLSCNIVCNVLTFIASVRAAKRSC